MRHIYRFCSALVVAVVLVAASAWAGSGVGFAQTGSVARAPSNCLAIAESLPRARFVSLKQVQGEPVSGSVRISYVSHSTFWIESPGGVTIATDYAGWTGRRGIPRVVTMNKAHETHFTDSPDPAIEHVLRGWNPEGGRSNHNLEVGDVLIRNVTTDIRGWQAPEKDANSIFIFEISGLCIGHLGHLHHELGAGHLGWIGRLDVVMVPVDGSWTLPIDKMAGVIKQLRSRVILPMHAFGDYSLSQFVANLSNDFAIRREQARSITLSTDNLPAKPTVIVLEPQF
ncbi:MBL fold metallo-hydrolase [Anderseniella sp. Alg231-50]|uniref:MBL fold metallo-hydrolase n=1 Tax=Anderseniella sp. Alg231-50 TaxID=1922226 RepID=UPI00307C4F68